MTKPKKRRWIFPLLLGLYALAVLVAAAFGLDFFWDYIDAYEQSRPYHAVDAYMEKLTADYVCDRSADLIDQIDHHVQSKEACRQVIKNALAEGFTYFKKSNESTATRTVYILRSGKRDIGRFEIAQQGEAVHGFTPWEPVSDSFDLSFLLTDPVSVTVPHDSLVYVNGSLLTDQYITEDDIPYTPLKEYYSQYTLPHMCTYSAGPFLSEPTIQITDPKGDPRTFNENTDMNQFLDNCTPEEIADLKVITDSFIGRYVDFTSCTDNDSYGNYNRLKVYMVPNGALAARLYGALDGLYWVSDRHAKVAGIDIHHFVNLGQDRYLCDLTYRVDTRTYQGAVQTSSNVKIIFLNTADGLKAESMVSY